jgi:transcriptional antiterminator RfaH
MQNLTEWFAFYTMPRSEKKVAEKLEKHRYEYYLPLVKTLKQWSDRKKMVVEPVFKSYIFVRVSPKDINKVLPLEGILKVISFGQVPQSIPENQIAFLKLLLETPELIEIHDNLQKGDRVRVAQGALRGAEGYLVSNSSKNFRINVDIVGHSISVSINPAYLEKVDGIK